MNENVWIWNHYATNMIKEQAGRHYWIAEQLKEIGYLPLIFCASTLHNSQERISTNKKRFVEIKSSELPFIVINTPQYFGNGFKRIMNMIFFYKNILKVSKVVAKQNGIPDIIIASSVHPLSLVAGIKVAKKFGIPCICEIRDLWPESIIAYGKLSKTSLISRLLYFGEKWIYKHADKLIFTMEGGLKYIEDKKWDFDNGGPIDKRKIYHLNNGVDLAQFDFNSTNHIFEDKDLEDDKTFKVIYTGSIRKVNDVDFIVDIAEVLNNKGVVDIKFIIFGDGSEKERLIEKCKSENIDNVIFKDKVPKKYIPYILNCSNLNLLHFKESSLKQYGASLNKLFEYFASGKPILSDCEFGYDLIKKYNSGFILDNANPVKMANEIIKIKNMDKDIYEDIGKNARNAAKDYDFRVLTKQLIEIIEK